jgi:hypothetical protein
MGVTFIELEGESFEAARQRLAANGSAADAVCILPYPLLLDPVAGQARCARDYVVDEFVSPAEAARAFGT